MIKNLKTIYTKETQFGYEYSYILQHTREEEWDGEQNNDINYSEDDFLNMMKVTNIK